MTQHRNVTASFGSDHRDLECTVMRQTPKLIAWTVLISGLINAHGILLFAHPASASAAGNECRKSICDAAVSECMKADLALTPAAGTPKEKKDYCAQFFDGCMSRTIVPNVSWYSPDTVKRFLNCPS